MECDSCAGSAQGPLGEEGLVANVPKITGGAVVGGGLAHALVGCDYGDGGAGGCLRSVGELGVTLVVEMRLAGAQRSWVAGIHVARFGTA
jgi:hypothetical protein